MHSPTHVMTSSQENNGQGVKKNPAIDLSMKYNSRNCAKFLGKGASCLPILIHEVAHLQHCAPQEWKVEHT